MINAHINGEIFECDLFDFNFCNTDVTFFTINGRSKFSYLKETIEKKLQCCPVAQIIYKNSVIFTNNQVNFFHN